jgi:hypothetical protein
MLVGKWLTLLLVAGFPGVVVSIPNSSAICLHFLLRQFNFDLR